MALTETDVSDVGLGLGGRHVGMLREEPEEEGLREMIGGGSHNWLMCGSCEQWERCEHPAT